MDGHRLLRGTSVKMATAHLGPDPFDEDIEKMLADPEFTAKLDDLHKRFDRGELVLHTNEEARAVIERRERDLQGREFGV